MNKYFKFINPVAFSMIVLALAGIMIKDSGAQTYPTYRLLVVVTPAAYNALGGGATLRSRINGELISKINLHYLNSPVNGRVELAGIIKYN